ncbi:hypothetical protein VZT92_013967 [Zoarces viviparus]|uniref:protein-glutamine gamma-glutamyltransferase n=1 Tax=Zoarces viviparus TaxID=48416 RepID=A0AAW1EZS6_ZOAVI
MSGRNKQIPNNHRGRYTEPVPTSNLGDNEEDFPEFESFDDTTPRGYAPSAGSMSVQNVNMLQQMNKPRHYTNDYDISHLVVRRGQLFHMEVTFSRPLTDSDDFQVEFLIGSNPTASKGSLVAVTFGHRRGGSWSGQILERRGTSVRLGITPTATAIVGRFRTYVAIVAGGGMQRTRRNPDTDLYLLFNAWCPQDTVYLGNEAERREYVLNDYGVIHQGTLKSVVDRSWIYGQFERGVLDACIYILDQSEMPIYDRGNIIKVVRKGSAMVNAQDDKGVLVGNWSNNYSMGRSPTSWTGSIQILLQYANTGTSVSFAQCWVFAGVFNTFLRAIGIPARIVTNFNSAHDNTGNLKTDLIFNKDGSADERNSRDSIWNYHCWNEVWITRQDLPAQFHGWNVVDSTPQETSDGLYRCGPASVYAIKTGQLFHPYDAGFVFAEVNSDVIFHQRTQYGTLEVTETLTDLIGEALYTKAVNSNGYTDITHTYKYREGSADDKATMARAEQYGCERDHSELPENQLSITLIAEPVMVGEDVSLQVNFHNQGDLNKTVNAHLTASVVFYTGVVAEHFKALDFVAQVPTNQTKTKVLRIPAEEYFPHLGSQVSLRFILTGQTDNQSVTGMKVLNLKTPSLNVSVEGPKRVGQVMYVTVSFTNEINFRLEKVKLSLAGPGMLSDTDHYYSSIEPLGSITWTVEFHPRLSGSRTLVAVMDCDNLRQVMGSVTVNIMP